MDIQKLIQVIADVFGGKKQTGDTSSLLGQVLTTAKEAQEYGGDEPPAKVSPQGGGLIGYYGLTDWWLSTFTEEERKEIQSVRPSLVVGDNEDIIIPERSYPGFTTGWLENRLSSLAIEFIGSKEMDIAARLLAKAEEAGGAKLLDRHFAYQGMAQAYYRHRNDDPEALDLAIDACEKQIHLGPEAAKVFLAEDTEDYLPAHHGFQQLAIIREREREREGLRRSHPVVQRSDGPGMGWRMGETYR